MEVKYLQSTAPPVNVIETPLQEVILYVSRKHDIPVEMDWENLESLGLTKETPITLRMIDGSLITTMQAVLRGHDDLRIVSSGNGIRVTIKDAAGADSLELPPLLSTAERRFYALLRAIDAEGYRVNFKNWEERGQEEATLERVAAP